MQSHTNRENERFEKNNLMPSIRKASVLIASLGIAASMMGFAAPANAASLEPSSSSSDATSSAEQGPEGGKDASEPKAIQLPMPVPAADPVAPGSIGGIAFEDLSGNSLKDPGEPSLAGAVVSLLDGTGNAAKDLSGAEVPAQTVGAAAAYKFTDLAAGSYTVKVVLPPGMKFVYKFPSPSDSMSSIGDNGLSDPIVLEAGQDTALYGVGGYVPAKIGGTFFDDLNGNGTQDVGEPTVSGGSASLFYRFHDRAKDAEGNYLLDAVTSADGRYGFGNLRAADYSVFAYAPEGYVFNPKVQGSGANVLYGAKAQADRKLDSRSDLQNVSFALVKAEPVSRVEISGTVYDDLKGDGVWDLADPGISGAKVVLLDENSVPVPGQEIETGAEGGYLFANLPAGSYKIKFILPNGFARFTAPNSAGVSRTLDLRGTGGIKKIDAGVVRADFGQVSGAGQGTMAGPSVLANTGASGPAAGFALGGGFLLAGAASVYFARRRREA